MKILLEKKKKLMRVAPKIQKVWDKKKDCCLIFKKRVPFPSFLPLVLSQFLAFQGYPSVPSACRDLIRLKRMVARLSCSSSSRGIAASRFRAASAAAKPSLNLLRPEAGSPAAGYRSSFLSSSNNPMLRLSGVVCGASSKSSGDKVEVS